MRQIRVKIDTTFSEHRPAGIGAKYLNSGEIRARDGVELAITCLFTPIGAAMEGATLSEIKQRQEIARTIFETWMNLATSRAEVNEENNKLSVETKLSESTYSNLGFERSSVTSALDSERLTSSEELKEFTSTPVLDEEINFEDEEF